ncbi:NAD(P)-binding protein [Penicillium longicatenatum]|nr:NAD(P)-binding protein [Penicillium longicatenatum]
MRRLIFVTGATGWQGTSLITALRPQEKVEKDDYHILALTRDKTSPAAKHLSTEKHITLVEGDLNNRSSIEHIFQEAVARGDRIWGVFVVLAFPGLGQIADAEEAQGKMLADIALEYSVSAFIYSSALRSGHRYDDQQRLSSWAKVLVERHIKALGSRGLPWVIVRPGFFMENFLGMLGPLALAVEDDHSDMPQAATDIGRVVAAIYKNFGRCHGEELALISDSLSSAQIGHDHAQAIGSWFLYMWWPLAMMALAINPEMQELVRMINDCHHRRANGEYPEYDKENRIAREICPERTSYREWINQTRIRQGPKDGWNRLSLWGILAG